MLVVAALHLPTVHWTIPGTHTVLDFKEIVGIVVGIVVVVLLVAFIVSRVRSNRGTVKTLLASPDPSERIAGVDMAASQELGQHVRALRRLSGEEKDPRVLKELAEVVARHQWEPSDNADLVELRIWAHRYYSERAGVRGPGVSVPAGPVEPAQPEEPAAPSAPVIRPEPSIALSPIPGVTTPLDLVQPETPTAGPVGVPPSSVETIASFAEPESTGAYTVLERAGRPAEDLAVADVVEDLAAPGEPETPALPGEESTAVPEPETPPAVSPEEPVVPEPVPAAAVPPPAPADLPCILVTGAGGAAGVTVIRALMAAGHRVVAVDRDPMAVGMRLAHAAQMIPGPDDPEFADFVCKLSVHQGAKAVISTVSEELPSLANHRELFEEAGIATWFPDRSVVQACIDKWLFHLAAKSAGLPVPPTNLGSAEGVPGPWIVKPRFGRGSRDILWADTRTDLEWALGHVPGPLVQTRLAGREFTVDSLVARDGTFAGAVPRWRLATRGGITTRGETFANDALLRLVENLLRSVAMRGAANVQGFASRDGNIMFTEINPRFSGGLALSLAAGADLVGQFVNGMFELPIDTAKLRYRPGVKMLRYFDEVFEG
jgi:carbamoyl-phosphate synthase large subunit